MQAIQIHKLSWTTDMHAQVGLHEGDVISPTLYLYFIDDLLREVWAKHPGVTLLGPGTSPQVVAAMQAVTVTAVSTHQETLPCKQIILWQYVTALKRLGQWLKQNISTAGNGSFA
jgi:hypothetical protein